MLTLVLGAMPVRAAEVRAGTEVRRVDGRPAADARTGADARPPDARAFSGAAARLASRTDADRETITLNVSRGRTVRLPRPAATIFVADPAIADIQTPSTSVVFVFGKKPGRTSLFALGDEGEPIAEYQVVVVQPIEDLRELLRNELGDLRITVSYTPNGAVLSGSVPNAAAAETAKSITAQFLGPGAVITNRLKVAGAIQVNLRVRVAEVSRDVAKEFGVNISAAIDAGNFRVGLISGRPVSVGAGGVSGSAGSGNGTGLGSSGFGPARGNGGGSIGLGFNAAGTSISAVIDALAAEGLVSILAEPNLTAVSGEPASFLAGGEFPIPIAQGDERISVEFKRFGVSLEFVPTVLAGDLISMRVRPEVSDISSRGAVVIQGINIPAIVTRRADTTIELASGQSFAIGGLIRKGFSTNVSAFPFLGDIPVLGALFRSSQFQKNESELVILVTPYIVRPAASAQATRVPTERVAPPSDFDRVLVNRLAKPPVGRSAPAVPSPRTLNEPAFIVD